MTIVYITPTFSVSGELGDLEFQILSKKGVDTVVNLRPDNESAGQKNSANYQKLVQYNHMRYGFIPVKPCEYSQQDIAKFSELLAQSNSGLHSFCRTGTRAIHLWALANKGALSFQHMQSLAKKAGFDLDMIAARFE